MKFTEVIRKVKIRKYIRRRRRVNPNFITKELLTFIDFENRITPSYTADGEFFAFTWCHVPYYQVDLDESNMCGDDAPHCEAMLSLEKGQHELTAINPMSITPSLVCPACGKHGYLHRGKYMEVGHKFDFTHQVPG